MLSNYKKLIKITKVHGNTGVLTYNLFYDTMITNLSEEVTRIQDSLNIVNRLPESGDKIFFLNGVTIPRFKIKKFYEDTGAKGVKYIDSSNLLVIGKNTIKEHFIQSSLYTAEKEDIINYMDNWVINNINEDNTWVLDLKTFIDEIDEDIVISGYYNKDRLINAGIDLQKYSTEYLEISVESYDKLDKILNFKGHIVDETIILKQLNSNVVMNEEIYNSIQNLMNSKDHENMKIAMELMSNCDYDNSALYLLLLLKNYSNRIDRMHTKHHINFKALLNYFDFTVSSNFNISIDEIIEKLKSKNLLVPSQRAILVSLVLHDFNPESTHYRVSDVIFMDDDGNDILIEDKIIEVGSVMAPAEIEITEKAAFERLNDIWGDDKDGQYEASYQEHQNQNAEDDLELDPIIYDELSDVMEYYSNLGISKYRDIILEVRGLCRPSDDLLEIIKLLDISGAFEEATLLTQSYLDLP